MTKCEDQALFELLFDLEKQVMSTSIRKNRDELEKIIGDDFVEFGSSGAIWTREAVLSSLPQEESVKFEALDFNARRLSGDCVQVTYKTKNHGGISPSASLRSSIWKENDGKWRMIFHQGTRITPSTTNVGSGMKLTLESDGFLYAVCRLDSSHSLPPWAVANGFYSISKTIDELSVVCPQAQVPLDVKSEKDWRCLKVKGPLDFALTGVLASLSVALANAGVSIFAISTFDTDYILVKSKKFNDAVAALKEAGHEVSTNKEAIS